MESQIANEPISQNKAVTSLLPSEFMEKALLSLPERSKEIMIKRFDLNGEGIRTLEEIGQLHKITRERVRQIEKSSMVKIKAAGAGGISGFNSVFQNVINKNGGVAEHDFFLDKVIDFMESERGGKVKDRKAEKRNLALIIALADEIKYNLRNKKFKDIFYLDEESLDAASLAIGEAIKFFEEEKKSMLFADIFGKVKISRAFGEKNINLTEEALRSYFALSLNIGADPHGRWGLRSWPFILPRSVRDKAYLVLFYKKEPLHFKKIAELIDETWPKKKKPALAETVHNELIKDRRFVLVGRGIYALGQWGYAKGTVQDIIKNVLAKNARPMKREEIIKEVSSQRIVKPSTIVLNLKNKDIFTALPEGLYKLKAQSEK